jgi:hypothetical protein
MQIFLGIAYLVVGIVQLFAIIDGIGYALHAGKIVSFIVAMIITYIPLLGSAAGVYGAVHVWDRSIFQAAVLFFWYIPVIIIVAVFGGLIRR